MGHKSLIEQFGRSIARLAKLDFAYLDQKFA